MAKHSALEPCSAGRTHRLHGRELSPSDTPGPWLLECRGRPICFPAAWLRGWTGLPTSSPAPQIPPGFGGCPCVPQSITPAPCSAAQAASGGCQAPCCHVVLWMLLLQIVAVQMHFVYFSLSVPSPLHPSPPPLPCKRGVLPNPLGLGWEGSTLCPQRAHSGCPPLVCRAPALSRPGTSSLLERGGRPGEGAAAKCIMYLWWLAGTGRGGKGTSFPRRAGGCACQNVPSQRTAHWLRLTPHGCELTWAFASTPALSPLWKCVPSESNTSLFCL